MSLPSSPPFPPPPSRPLPSPSPFLGNGNPSKIKVFVLFLSVLTIVFCLGVGWAVVRPLPVPASLPGRGLFQPASENDRPTPPKDLLLQYPHRSEIVFWNDQMKTEGLPFTFYQIETTDKPEKVASWYREQWTHSQLLVIGRPSKKNTERRFKSLRLEAVDYHDKRFLNVHLSWNEEGQVCEILATAITIDAGAFHQYIRDLKSGRTHALVTEGKTPQGKTWKREMFSENDSLQGTLASLKNRYVSEGWTLEAEQSGQGDGCLSFKNSRLSQTAFLSLKESADQQKTQVQRLIVEEEA